MSFDVQVLGIAGSLRARSFNKALLRAAQELVPEGMSIEIFDIASIPMYNGDVEAMWRARDAQVPMGHMGDAWDVANAALYLASDESRYITGIELVVDGGVTLKVS